MSLNNPFAFGYSEDDEITTPTMGLPTRQTLNRSEEKTISELLDARIKELKESRKSGIENTRYITSEILRKAPKGYFTKFLPQVLDITGKVQVAISEAGKSDIIRAAKENPTDDGIQNAAYWEVSNYIFEEFSQLNLSRDDKPIMTCMVVNELLGFSVIDPLWRDATIDEIMIDGPDSVIIEVEGNLHRVNGCGFRDKAHLMDLIEKLYKSVNKTLSATNPQEKGRLHDNSRLYANHEVIAVGGPTLNIRRHQEDFWTPEDLVNLGSANEEIMTLVGNLINKKCSFLVMGGMSTGKTSMLNALTGFYPDNHSILTLEDNVEMKPNPRKMLRAPLEVRKPGVDRVNDPGNPMRSLVYAATQMRPDVIIVGEVTDDAAYDLCQALNLGHYGASTVHANNPRAGVYRLKSLISQSGLITGDGALPLICTAFDFIIQVERLRDGSRKITSISEIGIEPIRNADGDWEVPIRTLWKFEQSGINPKNGKIEGAFIKVNEISQNLRDLKNLDIIPDMTWEELKHLSRIEE